jgi:raffinose/stachyose/melibiose transport system substrate-binding protein
MPRLRFRVFPVALVALLLCLGAAPRAGVAQDEKVELRVWDQFTGPETEAVDQIYEAFTAQHPNITIRREAIQTEQMRDTVNTALASGTGPDVIFYDAGPGYAGVLANAGLLLPLEEMASQYGWKETIDPSALQGTSIDGQIYGLPLQVDLIGMYYNKTLLDQEGFQVPETFEQLKTFCGEAKAKGYIPMALSDNPGWQAFHQFSMTANAMIGTQAMHDLLYNKQGNWNTPEIIQAIKYFFVDLRDAGCFSDDVNALTYDDAAALFFSGQSLLNSTGSWLMPDILANMPDTEIGFVPFPALDGAKGRYWISGVGSAYYISAKSQHQTEAGVFLDYLFSPEAAKMWVEGTQSFVPVKLDTATLDVAPLFKSIIDVLQTGIAGETEFGYNIDVLAPPAFNDMMQNGFQAMLSGDKTPEQQAADLQTAWEQT